ncbi:3-oxoacyl-ACP reductase [Streptomyces tateyamensis]|uniref:3-oxoacyl-ACP reductase n=1 Tax=Streptomyces tateyamensis TaxID=565073 RepID=A0A2V4NMP0_9ACTN|nr:SDR family NAD(P)-dependent oxidoreductase [Streptomyces tateyamensis]PYC83782.1 3-oxoacyl-ACP reductase [Streptomyces tateyamensis]
MELQGKTAVVTGGTRGLGRQIAEAFLRAGARVVVAGRDQEPVRDLLAAGSDVRFHRVDVTDDESVEQLLADAAAEFGGLDVVVANAGVSRPGRVAALAVKDWAETFETNVNGTFRTVRAAAGRLAEGGRIITLSSAMGSRVAPGASAYCASKAAIEMLTKVAAVELAERGITVNCLAPGIIDEGMGRQLTANTVVWEKYRAKLAAGRPGSGAEVAAAAVFLASPASSYVNGHVLEVNGGLDW